MLLFSLMVIIFIYTEWYSYHAAEHEQVDFFLTVYSTCRLLLYPLNWCALWWPLTVM